MSHEEEIADLRSKLTDAEAKLVAIGVRKWDEAVERYRHVQDPDGPFIEHMVQSHDGEFVKRLDFLCMQQERDTALDKLAQAEAERDAAVDANQHIRKTLDIEAAACDAAIARAYAAEAAKAMMEGERDSLRVAIDAVAHQRADEWLWRWLLHKLGIDPTCREFGSVVGHIDNLIARAALHPTEPPSASHEGAVMRTGLDDPLDDLVARFSSALLAKLKAAREKYGHDEHWKDTDWREKCMADLHRHIAKGDPRDVAAYCAFAWHHGWKTTDPVEHVIYLFQEDVRDGLLEWLDELGIEKEIDGSGSDGDWTDLTLSEISQALTAFNDWLEETTDGLAVGDQEFPEAATLKDRMRYLAKLANNAATPQGATPATAGERPSIIPPAGMYFPCSSPTNPLPLPPAAATAGETHRMLAEGELIMPGDEYLDDVHGWLPARMVGEHAPSPVYTSHRQYRRPIAPAAAPINLAIAGPTVYWNGNGVFCDQECKIPLSKPAAAPHFGTTLPGCTPSGHLTVTKPAAAPSEVREEIIEHLCRTTIYARMAMTVVTDVLLARFRVGRKEA